MRQITDNILSGTGITTPQEAIVDMRNAYGFSFHVRATKNGGAVAGTVKLQVSNNGKDFTDYPTYSAALADGDNEVIFEIDGFHFGYVKLVFDLTGGDVDLNSDMCRKG